MTDTASRSKRAPTMRSTRLQKRKVTLKDGRYLFLYEPKSERL
jgi:hypothetical protein